MEREGGRVRERAGGRINFFSFFYEGSGEDSRSFYIQPSPMRETTIN